MNDEQKPSAGDLTHFDASGRARMVDVGGKEDTFRIATASARVAMAAETVATVREGRAAKGDVLAVAQVAAIMAAKKTHELVPMCHPLLLTAVDIEFTIEERSIGILATVKTRGQTGVEMEALTAAGVAALTIYDMVKAIDRGMLIERIQLETKSGGRSGEWKRADER